MALSKRELQNEILGIIRTVFEDKEKLEQIHKFLIEEIYEEPEPEEVPEKYKKVVHDIAENISAGYINYFNPETMELEDVPQNLIEDPEEFEMMTGETIESLELKHLQWDNYITIEPMDSRDSFRIMERFVDQVEDAKLRKKLIHALNNRKPFANFKWLVENSDYREEWFTFRQSQFELYAWGLIELALPENDD